MTNIAINELRVGNWVHESEVPEGKDMTIDRGWHIDENGEYDAIPLTEEWLIKFGFEKKPLRSWKGNGYDYQPENSFTEQQDYVLPCGEDHDFWVRYEKQYYRKTDVEAWTIWSNQSIHEGDWDSCHSNNSYPAQSSVHRLQNLYFALTNNELQIK